MWKTRHSISILTAGLALAFGALPASAQTVSGQVPGIELLTAGEVALAKGQFASAAQSFAKALRSNDLDDEQVAKALYQRGVAYERSGRSAQAIADITSALYLLALSNADRAKAYLSRGRAYEAVGMSELARADISRARSGGVSEKQIARSGQPAQTESGISGGSGFTTRMQPAGSGASGPSFSTTVETAGNRSSTPAFSTRSETRSGASGRQRAATFETQAQPAPAREEAIPGFRTTILPQTSTKPAAQTAKRTAAARPSGNAASGWNTSASSGQAPKAPDEQSGSGVGRFFGNLWSKTTDSEKKQTAAATPPAPSTPQWTQTTRSGSTPQPSWNAQVSTPAQSPLPAQPVATARPAPATGGSSGYRIQLAALRSDAEAQATWKRLQARHKTLLAGRQPSIVKTELGGLGTFYRVQLGPFSDKASSQQLCKDFKSGGLDCFLLAP